MAGLIAALESWSPWTEIVLIGLILLLLVLAVWLLMRARARRAGVPKAKQEDGGEAQSPTGQSLRRSFRSAFDRMRDLFPGHGYRYATPIFLTIGDNAAGKTTLVQRAGLSVLTEHEAAGSAASWSFFGGGALVDLNGDVLGLNKLSGEHKPWEELIALLQRYRPERPMDGVVLAISVSDLVGPQAYSLERLNERGEILNRRLGRLQARLGMQLPIYVVLTQADRLAGFVETVALMPEDVRQDVLGWSSPYPPDSMFSPSWTGEAVETLHRNAREAAVAAMVSQPFDERLARAILLTNEISVLEEPLSVLLSGVFRLTTYNPAAMLRGVYLVGEAAMASAPLERPKGVKSSLAAIPAIARPAGEDDGGGRGALARRQTPLAFVRGLLQGKVFPEYALAKPFSLGIVSLNRRILSARLALVALAIIGFAGLVYGNRLISFEVTQVELTARNIEDEVRQQRRAQQMGVDGIDMLRQSTISLIQRMSATGSYTLYSLAVPSSWVSGLPVAVSQLTRAAYRELFFNNIAQLFQMELAALSVDVAQLPRAYRASPTGSDPLPFYANIDAYLDDVIELDSNVQLYNDLTPGATGAIDDGTARSNIRQIVQYVFGIEVPVSFYETLGVNMLDVLSDLREVSYDRYRPGARAAVQALFQEMYDDLQSRDGLASVVSELAIQLDMADGARATARSDFTRLGRIRTLIGSVQGAIGSGDYDWLASDSFSLGPDFEQRLQRVSSASLLGDPAVTRIRDQGARMHREFRAAVLGARSDFFGPVLQTTADGRLSLAGPVATLYQRIQDLPDSVSGLGDDPSALIVSAFPQTVPPDQFVVWDTSWLARALREAQDYASYLPPGSVSSAAPSSPAAGNGMPMPPSAVPGLPTAGGATPVDESLRALVSREIVSRTTSYLRRAVVFQPVPQGASSLDYEVTLGRRVANFAEAAPLLEQLFALLDGIGAGEARAGLVGLASSEAYGILDAAQTVLNSSSPYRPRGGDFSWWDGRTPASLGAFGSRNTDELQVYLNYQRERVAFVARSYAGPGLDFLLRRQLGGQSADLRRLNTWRSIRQQVDGYAAQDASNTITELEAFVLGPLTNATPDLCTDLLRPDIPGAPSDFFLARLKDLSVAAARRCATLSVDQVAVSYDALAEQFNQRLAGNFPFVPTYVPRQSNAATGAVSSFMTRYNAFMNSGEGDPARWQSGGPQALQALAFLESLDDVAAIFRNGLEMVGDEASVAITAEVDFRVNRANERAGDQIIEWSVTVGSQTIDQFSADRTVTWRPGDPVTVSFRWARNAPTAPQASADAAPTLSVSDRTARFDYGDGWGLIGLIQSHRPDARELPAGGDATPHTLGFTIPMTGGTTDTARVFLRMQLRGPDSQGGTRIVIPESFPTQAPVVVRQQAGG